MLRVAAKILPRLGRVGVALLASVTPSDGDVGQGEAGGEADGDGGRRTDKTA